MALFIFLCFRSSKFPRREDIHVCARVPVCAYTLTEGSTISCTIFGLLLPSIIFKASAPLDWKVEAPPTHATAPHPIPCPEFGVPTKLSPNSLWVTGLVGSELQRTSGRGRRTNGPEGRRSGRGKSTFWGRQVTKEPGWATSSRPVCLAEVHGSATCWEG